MPRRAWLLSLLVSACAPLDGDAPAGRSDRAQVVCAAGPTVEGVDVSALQPNTDWGAVAASGRKFALIKATEGDGQGWFYENPYFAQDWSGAKAHGLVRGAYHFWNPSENGTDQANYFYGKVQALGGWQDGDLPPMMDFEAYCDNNDCVNYPRIANATLVAHAHEFLDRIQQLTGRVPLIYTYTPDPNYWAAIGNPGGFGQYPLFMGDYYVNCPDLPVDWSNWAIWQYSSRGSVPGISKIVDLDQFNGTEEDLQRFACGGAVGQGCTKQSDCCGTGTCERGTCVACPADAANGCTWNGCGGAPACAIDVAAGAPTTATLVVYNETGAAWPAGQTELATASGMGSPLATPSWSSPSVAVGAAADVAPGESIAFAVPIDVARSEGVASLADSLAVMVGGKPTGATVALQVTARAPSPWQAAIDRIEAPPPAPPGQVSARVTLANTGAATWRAGKVGLALDGGAGAELRDPSWRSASVPALLAADAPPGSSAAIALPLTTPAPGQYLLRARLFDADAGPFGPIVEVPVTVQDAPASGCSLGHRAGPPALPLAAFALLLGWRRRQRLAALALATLVAAPAARADAPAEFAFALPAAAPDGGAPARPSATAVIGAPPMGQSVPAPAAFSIAKACDGCAFALVHVHSERVSSDDATVSFANPAKRFAEPVVLHFGTSDNHGDGTTPGAWWSPLHDAWAIAPAAADGTVSGSWQSGAWFASNCNGVSCGAMGTSVTVEVAAALVPDSTSGALRAHFPSERRQAFQAFNAIALTTAVDLTKYLPGVDAQAPLYFGAVEVSRISGDNTLLTVNGQGTQLACSDESAFAGDGCGVLYSPRHAHELAWPGSSDGQLHLASQTGGFLAVHPAGSTPELSVAIDGWVGGALPGGELYHPGDGKVVHAALDGAGHGFVALPDGLAASGQLPDVIVAIVTTRGLASDLVQVQVGDKVLQLGTSAAQSAGAKPGAAHDPAHSDLVFAHPTLVMPPAPPDGGAAPSDGGASSGGGSDGGAQPDLAPAPLAVGTAALEVQLGMGGFRDVQDPPTSGVYVQILGAFAPTVETATPSPPSVAGGCSVAPGRPPLFGLVLVGLLLALAFGLARNLRRK